MPVRNSIARALFPLLVSLAATAAAQPSVDLARMQAKYPGYSAVEESDSREIVITQPKDGAPEITFRDYRSVFILADNATGFSEGKEYFSSRFDIKHLEAYSLVPLKDAYKKFPVSRFDKSRETDDQVFFDDVDSYTYSYPSVGKGTRLVTTSESVVRDAFFPIVFFFGGRLPTDEAVFTVTMPASVSVSWHLFGSDTSAIRFTRTEKGKQVILTWSTTGLASYAEDDWSPSRRYFAPHIMLHISSYTQGGTVHPVIGSLDDLYAWDYSKIAGVNKEPSQEITRLADSLTVGQPDDRAKVRSIYRWVQENIRYVAIEDGDRGYVPCQAALVLQRRYGDCKDLSSLLVALVTSAGLSADFAWVGSRALPYRYTTFPSVANSNHMIAIWWETENQPVVLDGTSRYLGLDNIPSGLQGKQCLIAKGPSAYVTYDIPVSVPSDNTITDTLWITLDKGVLKGEGHLLYTGEEKEMPLAALSRADTNRYREVLSRLVPWASNKFQCSDIRPSDLKAVESPFSIRFGFSLPDYVTTTNGSVYVNLNLQRDLVDIQLRADRKFPVEMETPFLYKAVYILTVPEGYRADTLPAPLSFTDPHFGFTQKYSRTERQVVLSAEVSVGVQLMEGRETERFREMLSALNKAYLRSIILRKN